MEQRSPEWLAWRNGGIGSSDAASIVGVSPYKSRASLLREKRKAVRGEAPPQRDSWAMARGRANEPAVARWCESWFGVSLSQPCGEHDTHPFIRASYDGYEGDPKAGTVTVWEIKCPKREDHLDALAGRVPKHYMPQCSHLLLVSGASLLRYVSFSDFFPRHQHYAVVPMRPADAELGVLLAAELEFWGEVTRAA